MNRELTDDERSLISHITRWGSDGYPVSKVGRRWVWAYRSIKGAPTVFKTKHEAVASFEAFHDVILDCLREEKIRAAQLQAKEQEAKS